MKLIDFIIGALLIGLVMLSLTSFFTATLTNYGIDSSGTDEFNQLNKISQTGDLAYDMINQTRSGTITSNVLAFIPGATQGYTAIRMVYTSVDVYGNITQYAVTKLNLSQIYKDVFLTILGLIITFILIVALTRTQL